MKAMEQHRHERVVVETARHRIEGTLTLARDGYRSRVSDVLNATERDFVSLTDATLTPHDDAGRAERHPFVIVSRHQIVLAIPLDDDAGPSGGSQPPLTSV
jgi:hypothetical protein